MNNLVCLVIFEIKLIGFINVIKQQIVSFFPRFYKKLIFENVSFWVNVSEALSHRAVWALCFALKVWIRKFSLKKKNYSCMSESVPI